DGEIDELHQIQTDPCAMSVNLGDNRFQRVLERHVVFAKSSVPKKARALAWTPAFLIGRVRAQSVRRYCIVVIVSGAERRPSSFENDDLDVIVFLRIMERLYQYIEIVEAQSIVFVWSV